MAGFAFELVSPEKLLFSGDVEEVVIPGTEGDFAVLKDHAPVISALRPGVLSYKDAKGDKKAAKKKAPPKKAGKDEKPPKPIKWAPDKGPTPATTLDLIRSAVIDINESVFPRNIRQDH